MEPIHVDLGDGTHPPVLVYPNGQWVTTTRNQARVEAFKILFGARHASEETAGGGEAGTPHGDSPSTRENRWDDCGRYLEAES